MYAVDHPVTDLQKAIIHLDPNDAAIWVNDANLAMLHGSASAICQVPTCSGLQLVCTAGNHLCSRPWDRAALCKVNSLATVTLTFGIPI